MVSGKVDSGRFDGRQDAPATHRNREPILEVLRQHLPSTGTLLEIAAGTGQHAAFFAGQFPGINWQPTDPDARSRRSVDAWRATTGAANLNPALKLDVSERPWPVSAADVVLCINMLHIAPWQACADLFAGAAEVLPSGGIVITYGPYNVDGQFTSESNARFDASLRARDPQRGIRDIADVTAQAEHNGIERVALIPMPANNFTVVFRKR